MILCWSRSVVNIFPAGHSAACWDWLLGSEKAPVIRIEQHTIILFQKLKEGGGTSEIKTLHKNLLRTETWAHLKWEGSAEMRILGFASGLAEAPWLPQKKNSDRRVWWFEIICGFSYPVLTEISLVGHNKLWELVVFAKRERK